MTTAVAGRLGLLAAAALMLVACEEKDAGTPTTPAPPTQPSTGASQAPGGQLEQVQACSLLTEADAAQLSEGLVAKDMGAGSGASSGCGWSTSVDSGVQREDSLAFSINIRPAQTVAEAKPLDGGQVTPGKVGEREAKQIADDSSSLDGVCFLTFAVGAGRVDIDVDRSAQKSTEQACDDASKISTIIEPKLPK